MSDGDNPGETFFKPPGGDGQNATLIKSAFLDATLFKGQGDATVLKAPPPDVPQETLAKAGPGVSGKAPVIPAIQEREIIEGIYRVEEVIGQGGMGTVCRVFHLGWNIDLAVKSIRVDRTSPELLGLFLKEAETWMELAKHPNLVTGFYIKDFKGTPSIFMEFVDGGSLSTWLKKPSPPSPAEKMRVALQFCDGMIYAHSRNLIHRDIKPENVLMLRDGTVKITDFGLARKIQPGADSDSGKAQDLEICGTPAYMPPEQWSAASRATGSADVYSFGVMLFEILAGRRPFVIDPEDPRPPEIALRMMHLNEPPPRLSSIDGSLPRELDPILDKCLSKDPAARFSGFGELRERLLPVFQAVSGGPYASIPFDPNLHRANDLNNRALSFLDLGNDRLAEKLWLDALTIEPYHAASNANLIQLYWKRNFVTHGPTVSTLQKNLGEVDPVQGLNQRGILHFRSGRYDETMDVLESPSSSKLDTAVRHNLSGLTFLSLAPWGKTQGNFRDPPTLRRSTLLNWTVPRQRLLENAHREFTKAAELSPNHPGYQLNLSHVLRKMNLPHDAEKCLENARRLGSENIPHSGKRPEEVWDLQPVFALNCQALGNSPILISPRLGYMYVREGPFANSFEAREYALETGHPGRVVPSMDCFWTEVPGRNQFFSGTFTAAVIDLPPFKEYRRLHCKYLDRYTKGIRSMGPFPWEIKAMAVSPNVNLLLGARGNSTIEVWDISKMAFVNTLEGMPWSVGAMKFLDENRVLLCCSDGKIRVMETQKFSVIQESTDSAPGACMCILAPDGLSFFSGGEDGTIRRWDSGKLACTDEMPGHGGRILDFAFTPKGEFLLSASGDASMKVWDMRTNRLEKSFGAYSKVLYATFSSDGRYLAFANSRQGKLNTPPGVENYLRLWKIVRNEDLEAPVFVDSAEPVFSRISTVVEDVSFGERFQALLGKAKDLFSKGDFGGAYQRGQEAREIPGFRGNLELQEFMERVHARGRRKSLTGAFQVKDWEFPLASNISLSHDGRFLISIEASQTQVGRTGDTLVVKETSSVDPPRRIGPHLTTRKYHLVIPGTNRLLSIDTLDRIYLWDLESERLLRSSKLVPPEEGTVNYVFASPCGTYLLLFWKSRFQRFEIATLLSGPHQELQDSFLPNVHFSKDGRFFLIKPVQRVIDLKKPPPPPLQIWDSRSMKPTLELPWNIGRFSFGPGDTLWIENLVPGKLGSWSVIEQWSLASGGKLLSLEGMANLGFPCAFSPDQRHFAEGKNEGIHLWDLYTGMQPITMAWPKKDPRSLTFSHDGRFLISGSGNAPVGIWDVGKKALAKELPLSPPLFLSPDFSFLIGKEDPRKLFKYQLEWDWEFPDGKGEAGQAGAQTPIVLGSDLDRFLETCSALEKDNTFEGIQKRERGLFHAQRIVEAFGIPPDRGLSLEDLKTKRIRLVDAFISALEKAFSAENAGKVNQWAGVLGYLGRLIEGCGDLKPSLHGKFQTMQVRIGAPVLDLLARAILGRCASPGTEPTEEDLREVERAVEVALQLASSPGLKEEFRLQALGFQEKLYDLNLLIGERRLESGLLPDSKRAFEKADDLATRLNSPERKGRVLLALVEWMEKKGDYEFRWIILNMLEVCSFLYGPGFGAMRKLCLDALVDLSRNQLQEFFRAFEAGNRENCPGNPVHLLDLAAKEKGDSELAKEAADFRARLNLANCEISLERLERFLESGSKGGAPPPGELDRLFGAAATGVKALNNPEVSARFAKLEAEVIRHRGMERDRSELGRVIPEAKKFLDGTMKSLGSSDGIDRLMKMTRKPNPPPPRGLIPAFQYTATCLQRALKLTGDLGDQPAKGDVLVLLSQVHLLGNDPVKAEAYFHELEAGQFPEKARLLDALKKWWEGHGERLLGFSENNLREAASLARFGDFGWKAFSAEAESYFQRSQPILNLLKKPVLMERGEMVQTLLKVVPDIERTVELLGKAELTAAGNLLGGIRNRVEKFRIVWMEPNLEELSRRIAEEKKKRGMLGNLFGK